MARYIDAEPLLEEQYEGFDRANETDWQKGYWAGIDEMCEKIKAQPSSDVVEVVHARWEECDWIEYDGHSECIHQPKEAVCCSDCRNVFKKKLLWKDNYCPNCGAKMDGKKVE